MRAEPALRRDRAAGRPRPPDTAGTHRGATARNRARRRAAFHRPIRTVPLPRGDAAVPPPPSRGVAVFRPCLLSRGSSSSQDAQSVGLWSPLAAKNTPAEALTG